MSATSWLTCCGSLPGSPVSQHWDDFMNRSGEEQERLLALLEEEAKKKHGGGGGHSRLLQNGERSSDFWDQT